jgi:hypothetical protein
MDRGKEVESLRLRKQLLVLESNLNRAALQAEWGNVRAATAWVRSARQTFHQVRPWLVLLAPLAGYLTARRPNRPPGVLRRLVSAWRWIRALLGVWEAVRGAPAKDSSRSSSAC